MERAATLRRVQSLRNVANGPSGRLENRSTHGVLIRRKSVSELVSRYQSVLDHASGQKEEQLLDRNVLKTTKIDLLRKKHEGCQVQVNEEVVRGTCAESFQIQKHGVITNNRNLQTTFTPAEINSKVQLKAAAACSEQTQLLSSTGGSRMQPSIMTTRRPVTMRLERTDSQYHREATLSSLGDVQKPRNALVSEDFTARKAKEFPGRRLMETRDRACILPEKLNSSTKPKNPKALPHLDQLDGLGHIPLQGQKTAIPSVKERSTLYLSKAAAAYTLRPKKPQKTQEDIVYSFHRTQTNKCPSVTREMCPACFKPIYSMERMIVDKVVLHQSCFLCEHCNKKLSLHNYAVYLGHIYCKDHHTLLTKAKECSDESLNWKHRGHQLKKPDLETFSTSQYIQEEKTKMENTDRKKKLDSQYDGGAPIQIKKLTNGGLHHLDSGRRLRVRWPPLKNPSKVIKENQDRPVKIQWPPLSSGLTLKTSKPALIKQNVTIHTAQHGNTIAVKHAEKERMPVTNAPFSKADGNMSSLDTTGDGKRRLQQLTQKLKSHNGNIPSSKGGSTIRTMLVNDSVSQHTNSMLSNTSKATTGSFPTRLKVLKVPKSTNPKAVAEVKGELSVSSAVKHTNIKILHSLSPASKNTHNTCTKHSIPSDILERVSEPHPTADLTYPALTPHKFKQKSREQEDCENDSLDVQEESNIFTDQRTVYKEENGNVSPRCTPVTSVLTAQGKYGPTDAETLLSDEAVVSVRGLQDSEMCSAGQEAVNIGIDGHIVDPANVENNMFSYTKYLAQSESNVKAAAVSIPEEDSNGAETEKLKQSHLLESYNDGPEQVFQESPPENNLSVSVTEHNCSTSGRTVPCFQETDSQLSYGKVHHNQVLLGYNVMSMDKQESIRPAISTSMATARHTYTTAVAQSDMSSSVEHTTLPAHESNNVPEASNIQRPVSQDIVTASPEVNDNHLQSSNSPATASKNATPAGVSRSEAERLEVASFSPMVKENKKRQVAKEQSLKSTGFGKNPFSRLFPSEAKDRKPKQEMTGSKRSSTPKPQSALGKMFGLSSETPRKDKEQEEEVARSPQKLSGENSKIGEEQSHINTGSDNSEQTVITTNEIVLKTPGKGGRQIENVEECLESRLDDRFCYVKSQAENDQIEGLPPLKNKPAIEYNELLSIPGFDNSSHIGGAFTVANIPVLSQTQFNRQNGEDEPPSESVQERAFQKDPLIKLEGNISCETTIPQIGPPIPKVSNTSPDRQENVPSEIQGKTDLSVEHASSIVNDNLMLIQLGKEHQEVILHLDHFDLLGSQIPTLFTTVNASSLISDRNESGMYQQNIQSQSNVNVQSVQHCLELTQAPSNSESTLQSNDPALLLNIAPDLATASGPSSDIQDSHSFLNPGLMKQSDAPLECEGAANDPFGLGLCVLNYPVDHVRQAGDSMESMSQSTLVNYISENAAADMSATLNSAAVAIESSNALSFLDDSGKQNSSS